MKCKLCNTENELCDSHIIPESFWKTVNDSKFRSVPISTRSNKLEFVQNGITEKLLCQQCETQLSAWETTLTKDINDIGKRSSSFLKISEPKKNTIIVENIRYENFKLAALSILWRLSISSVNHFESYCLGIYEEKIRNILRSKLCPSEEQYSLMISQYTISNKFHSDLIVGFPKGRCEKFIIQRFIIWGHLFLFIVNESCVPSIPIECFLRNNGSIYICVCDVVELVSKNSVFSRIFDEDVNKMVKRLST